MAKYKLSEEEISTIKCYRVVNLVLALSARLTDAARKVYRKRHLGKKKSCAKHFSS